MKNLIKKYKHAWVFLYAFIYLPWFFYLERTVTKHYHVIHVALDDHIPFNEYFIIPYLFWFLYVGGAVLYFFFTDKQDFYRLCAFLFSGMTISLIICTLYPNGTDFRPVIDPNKNIFCSLVAMIYRADTCTNVLPSIHVYNSIGVHIAVMNSKAFAHSSRIRVSSFIIMVLICLSTVFLKQHSVLDGLAAITMAYGMYDVVYGSMYAHNRRRAAEKVMES